MGYYNSKKATDPKWIAGDEEHDAALAESGVSVEAASRVQAPSIRWLVENIIPHETVTVISGAPGTGKTFFACQLAADAARVSQLRVVLATSGEPPELLRWRLDLAEGDTRRIVLTTLTPKGFKDRRGGPTEEELDERLSILYHTLLGAGDPKSGILPREIKAEEEATALTPALSRRKTEHHKTFPELPRAAELLVIDDVDRWFGKPGNLLSAAALNRVIQRLDELARSLRVAIVVVAQTQLSPEGRITSRQLSRLSQAASVVWMIAKDGEQGTGNREQEEEVRQRGEAARPHPGPLPEGDGENAGHPKFKIENSKSLNGLGRPSSGQSPTPNCQPRAYSQSVRRWFLSVKNNLAPDAATYGRAFEIFDGQIRWHGDDAAPTLAEVLLPGGYNRDRRRERRAAARWIEEALAAGPLPTNEFFAQGIECGYSKGTLRRAADELGIHSHKTGFNSGWEMRWVPQPEVRGRGTTARTAGAGFRIFGGEDIDIKAEGKRQQAEWTLRGDNCATNCAPSQKCEENEAVSCASSAAERIADCEVEEGEPDNPKSTTENAKSDGASCAPSATNEVRRCGSATCPHRSPLPEGAGTCIAPSATNEVRPCGSATCPHPSPLPEGEGTTGEEATCAA